MDTNRRFRNSFLKSNNLGSSMHLFQRNELLMGNRFDLGVVGDDGVKANQALEKAIIEIFHPIGISFKYIIS